LLAVKKGPLLSVPNPKWPKRILYFAGPDVFYPNYPAQIALIKELCATYDFLPLIPGEESVDSPKKIFELNVELIARADGIVANLNPFRGQEPDSGTVFEVGYGFGLGKWTVGYQADLRPLIEKLGPTSPGPNGPAFADGTTIEDFGYPANLMLGASVRGWAASLAEALALIASFKKEINFSPNETPR
jgi:nucleoside 2-deoxyribosyltransferase